LLCFTSASFTARLAFFSAVGFELLPMSICMRFNFLKYLVKIRPSYVF
jgi:hypothetical protein